MPVPLLRYAWLFLALGFLINIGLFRVRLLAAAQRGDVTRADADRFVRVTLAGVLGPVLAEAAIGLASGQPNGFCPLMLAPTSSRFSAAAWTVFVLWIGIQLVWLWTGDGAELVARLSPFLGSSGGTARRTTARSVRLKFTAPLVLGAAGFFLLTSHLTDASGLADVWCTTVATAPHKP
jgi:hypothetical protein